MDIGRLARSVSGFGNLRVKAWLAAHRSLTQPSHVLHRLSTPKHPPDTLSNLTTFLARISSRGIKLTTRFLITTSPRDVKDHGPARRRSHQRQRARPGSGWPGGEAPVPAARLRVIPFFISRQGRPLRPPIPLTARCHTWWRRQGSNLRPPACKAGALPTELRPRMHHGGPVWTRTTDLTLIRRTL
jgi:hypothetical protein